MDEARLVPASNRKLLERELDEEASLLMPEGNYGPAFLTPRNYFVLKDYNFSDLYVLFVGHLSDRIAGSRPFEKAWSKNEQMRTGQVEEMQRILTAKGIYPRQGRWQGRNADARGSRRISESEWAQARLLADERCP